MTDKRLIQRLSDYWNQLRSDAPLPLWEKFNPSSFGDFWQQCCGWRVQPGQSETILYTYDFVGSAVKEALGTDPTGQMFTSQFRGFPGARIVQRLDEVVHGLAPLTEEGTFVNEANRVVKYRSCLLPFGTKDCRVTHIVLGLSWKAF